VLLCAALLLSLAACAKDLTQHDPPQPPVISDAPDTMTQEITAMSFNIYYGGMAKRQAAVVQCVLDTMPDSIGFQEAHARWRRLLKRELKGAGYAMACDKGRHAGLGEGVPILYRSDKYDLVEEGVFWLSERPETPSGGWDAQIWRITGYAVLKDKETGFTYAHFNTHFDHKGPAARINSARLTADRINGMNLPTVFTGDINAPPDSVPAQYLAAGGLLDLRAAAGDADTGSTRPGGSGVIDYVFANHYLREPETARFWVIRDEYDGMIPSDHYAVAARLTLAN